MKYVVILGDGWADLPDENGDTPLSIANKPTIDMLASKAYCGVCHTVPDGLAPGSDVANMSVMGYDPKQFYSGRSPLEAVSMGIELGSNDVTYRCNLVTLSGCGCYKNHIMDDYSAGEIDSTVAEKVINELNAKLKLPKNVELYNGISYRHCLVIRDGATGGKYTPPHDILGKKVTEYLPKEGANAEMLLDIMKQSKAILKNSEINKELIANGKKPVSSVWFWGEGTKPAFANFTDLYNIKGAVISAVDLVKGLGIVAGMDVIEVDGATGNLHTNFSGKAESAIKALETNDYVYIHVEAPDECGHQGDRQGKIRAIELIDEKIVKPIFESLSEKGEKFKMLITPDHPTPLCMRTHTSDPVPFAIYSSESVESGVSKYNEKNCIAKNNVLESGVDLIKSMLKD